MRPLLVALLLFTSLATTVYAAEVRLSAAASMTEAVKELVAVYGERAGGAPLLANFASSGTLARQIVQGAPTDLFVSAHPKWMSYLVEEGRIVPGKVRNLAGNALVFVGRKGLAVSALDDIGSLRRIAIGSPRTVPAGEYAEQALRSAGLYDRLAARLVMAQDVRHALVYADRGETDGAFVYRTDAMLARDAVVLLQVPQALYDEVTYPVGLTAEGAQKPEAVAFYEFLRTDAAAEILIRHGFVVR